MNIVLYILIVACTTYGGWCLAGYYRSRANMFEDLVYLSSQLKSKVSFYEQPIRPAVTSSMEHFTSELKGILEVYLKCLEQGQTSEENLRKNLPKTCLKDEEYTKICRFLSGLGRSNTENQTENLRVWFDEFRELRELAEKDRKRFAGVYVKMGLMVGLVVCLLLL